MRVKIGPKTTVLTKYQKQILKKSSQRNEKKIFLLQLKEEYYIIKVNVQKDLFANIAVKK